MNIYYCDACGKRLAADDSAKVVPGTIDKDIICPACLASGAGKKPASSPRNEIDISEVAAMPAAAAPARRPTSGAQQPRPATGANVRPSMQRPASAIQPRVTAQMNAAARASSTARNAVQNRGQQEPQKKGAGEPPKSNTPVIIGVVVAVIVLGGGGLMLLGGSKNKNVAQKDNQEKQGTPTATPQKAPESAPIQAPTPVPVAQKAGEAPKPEARPEPVAKATPNPADPDAGLSPKEAYEKRLREGKIKPPEPPPPMPEKLPDPDDTWKSLFNGKDTKGWNFWKGTWTAEDGMLVGKADPGKGGSIQSDDVSFADFDFACKMYVEGTKYAEVFVRAFGANYGLHFSEPGWKDIRISARGSAIKATVDGKPVNADTTNANASGYIGFYVSQPAGVMKLKDIKIKVYGK